MLPNTLLRGIGGFEYPPWDWASGVGEPYFWQHTLNLSEGGVADSADKYLVLQVQDFGKAHWCTVQILRPRNWFLIHEAQKQRGYLAHSWSPQHKETHDD